MLSIFLIVVGYAMAGVSLWRYRATQQRKLRTAGVVLVVVSSLLLIAQFVNPLMMI